MLPWLVIVRVSVVGPFYGFWQSFSTARSFTWLDKYDIRDAPNRYVVRAMEKENKKLRDAGKKERNEEIRQLVAYVRKRDKRVQEYKKLLEERRLEQERKNEENRRNMIRERIRQIGEHKESEEVRRIQLENLREIEEALDAEFGVASSEAEDGLDERDGNQPQYCIVCEKAFKTEKGLSNHEKSKKHRDAVAELKKHMQEEDLLLLEAEEDSNNEMASNNLTTPSKKTKKQKRRERKKAELNLDDEDASEDADPCQGFSSPQRVDELANGEVVEQDVEGNIAIEDEPNIFLKVAKSSSKPTDKEGKKKGRRRENGSDDKLTQVAGPRAGTCDKCGEVFESRTKLFAHLNNTGHATLKVAPAITNSAKANKKGKRK
ncbi:unnamed protein product [Toxocara canis]|uniref:C2H2-type domain-containing protein n=1 Tax=Toxocara canis TaxID=6265 RepID=A0A183VEN4_TOXCA|nr:unnamed protein product [Toxocara canis]